MQEKMNQLKLFFFFTELIFDMKEQMMVDLKQYRVALISGGHLEIVQRMKGCQ